MGIGDGALIGGLGYIAVGRENVFKTYNTCTAALPFLSTSIKTSQENVALEQIDRSRTYSESHQGMKKVEGDIEFLPCVEATALVYLLANAFGGTIASATATGDTAGAVSFDHTINIGLFDQSISSVCMNIRKGDSLGGKIFEYNGGRVNEIMFSAEMEEALKCTASMVFVDSTKTSNDVSAVLTSTGYEPLSFINGRVSVESSLGALTSTSYWNVQSVEIGLNNSLKSDSASGRIGSAVLDVLPAGMASFTFNATLRFNTTTAYDAMLANTAFAGEFQFQGTTLSGSTLRRSLKLTMPRIKIIDAGDPEIGGPDEVLTSNVTFLVLRDNSSATGYAMRAVVRNAIASY